MDVLKYQAKTSMRNSTVKDMMHYSGRMRHQNIQKIQSVKVRWVEWLQLNLMGQALKKKLFKLMFKTIKSFDSFTYYVCNLELFISIWHWYNFCIILHLFGNNFFFYFGIGINFHMTLISHLYSFSGYVICMNFFLSILLHWYGFF